MRKYILYNRIFILSLTHHHSGKHRMNGPHKWDSIFAGFFGICTRSLSINGARWTATRLVQHFRDKGHIALDRPCTTHGETSYLTVSGLESKGTTGSSGLIDWFPNLRHELLNQWTAPVCAFNWPLNGPISTSPEDDVTHSGVVDEHLSPL